MAPINKDVIIYGTTSDGDLKPVLVDETGSVGGGGGDGGGGDASAANQQLEIDELVNIQIKADQISQILSASFDIDNNIINTNDNFLVTQLRNDVGNSNDSVATSDTDNTSLISLVKRLLSVKLDRTLSQIETAINNISNGKNLLNIEDALLSLRFTFYNSSSTDIITDVNDFHSVDVAQRGKHISFQYEVSGIGNSATLEVQFSNNQGIVNAQGGTALWSRLNENDIVVTQNGTQEAIVINNIPASHVRLIMVAVDGNIPTITSYAMATK
ncbi:MAG: hypothetical protein WBF90_33635 [Rivularia sp. (in: cyanobacteria)]